MPQLDKTLADSDTLRISSIGLYQCLIMATGLLVLFADGFDAQIVSYAAPAIGKAWNVPSAAFAPVFAANVFGLMIGAMAITTLADSVGRKYVVAVCVAIFGLTSLSMVFFTSINLLAVLRFFSGLALGGAQPCLIAAVADYFPIRYRTRLAVVLATGWSLGLTVCGLLTSMIVETSGWQILFFIGSVMPLLLIPAILLFQPESPNFLIRRGRARELDQILKRVDPSLDCHNRDTQCGGGAGRYLGNRWSSSRQRIHGEWTVPRRDQRNGTRLGTRVAAAERRIGRFTGCRVANRPAAQSCGDPADSSCARIAGGDRFSGNVSRAAVRGAS